MSNNKYPECEKLAKVSEDSNKIGRFLDWLQSQGIMLAKYHEHTDDCYDEDGYDYECEYTEEMIQPVYENKEDMLARYYNIDMDKVEKERREILKKASGE